MVHTPRADIERSYRNTTYLVDHPEGVFGIRLGEPCPRLDALLAAHCVTRWAYVTAWNPRSQPLSAAVNVARHAELCASVAQLGGPVFAGRGRPDSGDWVPEESRLILGITEVAALAIAVRFGQHAIVIGESGGSAALVRAKSGMSNQVLAHRAVPPGNKKPRRSITLRGNHKYHRTEE